MLPFRKTLPSKANNHRTSFRLLSFDGELFHEIYLRIAHQFEHECVNLIEINYI